MLTESLDLFKALNNRPQAARTKLLQADAAARSGLGSEALDLQRSVLREFHEIDDHQGIALALEAIACNHASRAGNARLSLMLMSAATELRRQNGLQVGRARHDVLERFSRNATESLGDNLVKAAIEAGKKLQLREAVELGLNAGDQAASSGWRST